AAEHLRGARNRHGRVLVLAACRRDHQRPIRHRLLHLERLFDHQLSRHRCRHADHRVSRCGLHGTRARGYRTVPGLAEEGPMTSIAACLKREIAAGRGLWLACLFAVFCGFHLLQLSVLMLRFETFPNYVTIHDWPGSVVRIIRSTPSVIDMFPIIFDEWLV